MPLSANQGRILNDKITAMIPKSAIVNNLTTTSEGYVADARTVNQLYSELGKIPYAIRCVLNNQSIVIPANSSKEVEFDVGSFILSGRVLKTVLNAYSVHNAVYVDNVYVFSATTAKIRFVNRTNANVTLITIVINILC